MNTDPLFLAVVAALNRAANDRPAIGHIADVLAPALLRDLARLQRPVAWRIVDSVQGTHTEWSSVGEGHRIEVKHAEARGLQVEYAYPVLPGADAP